MEQTNEQAQSAPQSTAVELKRMTTGSSLAICACGLLVPGLGHMLIRRWTRGAIFAGCVLVMFILGLAMHGKLYGLEFDDPLHIFAFIANIGVGLPYWIAQQSEVGAGVMTWPSYDYGTTYLWVCGLLNYLIVIDAFDIAQGRKP